jgi:hypothetical protein
MSDTTTTTGTFADLTAALRDAMATGDSELVEAALAALEGYTPPAAPAKTATDVKRQVSQAIVDTLSENLDALVAGPADEPWLRRILRAFVLARKSAKSARM